MFAVRASEMEDRYVNSELNKYKTASTPSIFAIYGMVDAVFCVVNSNMLFMAMPSIFGAAVEMTVFASR